MLMHFRAGGELNPEVVNALNLQQLFYLQQQLSQGAVP